MHTVETLAGRLLKTGEAELATDDIEPLEALEIRVG